MGSFNTRDGWILQGSEWAGFDVTAALEYHKTDGQKRIIDSDQQTVFDHLYGTHASLAPGPVNVKRNNLDLRLELARDEWRFRAGLQQRNNLGLGAGIASGALSPTSSYTDERWNADLTYQKQKITDNWDVEGQLSYLDLSTTHDNNNLAYPPGTALPIGTNGQFDFGSSNIVTFPDGYIGNHDTFTRTARSSLSGNYAGFAQHMLRTGVGYNYSKMRGTESKNFGLDPATGLPINGASVVDVSNTSAAFILGQPYRRNSYFYIQDEWKFARDWALTGGVRYDHFSDFGNTTNPRLALVWQTRYDLTTKLMYGSAFRAPAFWELYLVNAPFFYSNPKLKPETMDTTELAFEYRPRDDLRLGWDLFHYRWNDIVGFVTDPGSVIATARNSGTQTGNGGELEAEWKATDTVKLSGNYSYQKSTDDMLNHDAGNAPHNQAYVRADWTFLPDWQLVPQAKWISGRERVAGDTRPPVADYTWVDLTLRCKDIREHWESAFSVRNLFNADAREPGPAGMPNDLPLAGRSVYGEIRFDY
jgi:iron complex outermembrane receptor protein